MAIEDEYFERGLSFLQEDPPNLIKALSLIRKANVIYEQKERIKEFNASKEKIQFVYKNLSEKENNKTSLFLRNGRYKEAILSAVKSYNNLLSSDPKNIERNSKKIKELVEECSILLLNEVQHNLKKNGFLEEYLNEAYFTAKVIRDVFFPQLMKIDNSLPSNFISEIQEKRKLQKELINTFELIGDTSKEKAKELISKNDINSASNLLNISKEMYNKADIHEKIEEIDELYLKIYELQGDAEYSKGQQMVNIDVPRLNKARDHIKRARNYYKKAKNEKKVNLAEEYYLSLSVQLGEHMLEEGKKAEDFGDLRSALEIYYKALKFFKDLNHKKYPQKIESKICDLNKQLGDIEFSAAESLNQENFQPTNENLQELKELKLPENIGFTVILKSKKLHHLRDALFYYQRAKNDNLINKVNRKIEQETEEIAEFLLNNARINFKNHNFQDALSNFKKGIFFYESIKRERKVIALKKEINRIYSKIKKGETESLEQVISENNNDLDETEPIESIELTKTVVENEQKDHYLCKSCGRWVKSYYYDGIQEKCINCREHFKCDECSKELEMNEPYMECQKCKGKFDLSCADRVYDFIQKKCASCREAQICDICNLKTNIGQSFSTCPKCGKDFCETHFDEQQGFCVRCRQSTKCSSCGMTLSDNEVFTCSVCNNIFCRNHFDNGRKVCINHRSGGICAKCGKSINETDPAFKCDSCGFIYCPEHYSTFNNKCYTCLGDLKCKECQKPLYNEYTYRCKDCNDIFCIQHFNITENRCKNCSEIASKCKVCNSTLDEEMNRFKCQCCGYYFCKNHYNHISRKCQNCMDIITAIGEIPASPECSTKPNVVPTSTQNSEESNTLYTTLKNIVDKYNNREVLEPEEINFLLRYSVNLSRDETKYINVGKSIDHMIILQDVNRKPFVALVPDIPIEQNCKYYGDLFQKLNKYLPDATDTLGGMTSIMNLIFYASNNPKWVWVRDFLKDTTLKYSIESLHLLMLIVKKASSSMIIETMKNTLFLKYVSGYDLQEIINFIKNNETEEDVGIFSEDDDIDHLLRVFFALNVGDILRASELLAIFNI